MGIRGRRSRISKNFRDWPSGSRDTRCGPRSGKIFFLQFSLIKRVLWGNRGRGTRISSLFQDWPSGFRDIAGLRGLRGIKRDKGQNARIKGGNGLEVKGKRAEGTWGPAEGRKMWGIKRIKGD